MVKITHSINWTNGVETSNNYEIEVRDKEDAYNSGHTMWRLTKQDLIDIQNEIIKTLGK